MLPFDSVYFFLAPGLRNEVQYDPWHYGRRCARQLPVVFVQPELQQGLSAKSEPEPRLDNVEILSIEEAGSKPSFARGLVQAGQLVNFMRQRNHRQPLLWFWNPSLLFPYALVPASTRFYWGNENYFESGEEDDFVNMMKAAIAISDKVICGSEGVRERFQEETGRRDIQYLPTNGCDYTLYANPRPVIGGWVERLQPVIATGNPIAVFAGTIDNWRLDFAFLHRLATTLKKLQFVYAGPVEFLERDDPALWAALLQFPNVTYLGFLDAADLPWLYHLSDRGFLPYRQQPMIVNNPIPLKSLEMAAAGLPVVSTLMKSLIAISDAVAVARDEETFIAQLKHASRKTRSAETAARADAICRRYDYDRLFEQTEKIVSAAYRAGPPRPASLAPIYDLLGFERTIWDLAPQAAAPSPSAVTEPLVTVSGPASRPQLSAGRKLLSHIPPRLAAWVPPPVKARIKRSLRL